MKFHVLTIFPGMFESPLSESILARGQKSGLIEINLHNIRDYSEDRHSTVDDYPFGGGYGMVMKPDPLFKAVASVRASASLKDDVPVVLLTPQGRRLTQPVVEEFAIQSDLMLVCGRYEGVDERVREHVVTHEISIGDYVISGGELAAMVLIDAISRLIPGVVGSLESTMDDSFTTRLLQHPQYTRPAVFKDMAVPDILLSGNHAEIARWRRQESLRRTYERRPDLLDSAHLSDDDKRFIESLKNS